MQAYTGLSQPTGRCFGCAIVVTTVTTLIVALRIAARFFVLRLRGADDWLIIAATTVTIANVVIIVIDELDLFMDL